MIEGEHLVEEAIKYGGDINYLLILEEFIDKYQHLLDQVDESKQIQVSKEVIKHISMLPSPQPILAIVSKKNQIVQETKTQHILILDNVQDPGNVGTMIRTADAAGFSKVILGEGSADIYSSKVVRAMQGSQFHIELEEKDLVTAISELKQTGYKLYGTELNEDAVVFSEVETSEKMAILMGNEGQGVSRELLKMTDQNIYIPMQGSAESLNVAVAAGIVMFSI